jgi:Glycosyl transferases group 1
MRGVCGSDTVSAGHSVMMKTRDHTVAVTCHLEPTQNLYHPFKLPEMMASSRAIVSHSLRTEFPALYLPGTHFLEFRSPEECVEQCGRILSDPSLARSLRQASWQYYQSQVRPGRHVGNLADRAIRAQGSATEKRK